jgi:hypothetical protein
MKAVGGGGGSGWRRMTVLRAVEGKRAASSPVVVGRGKTIVGGQWRIAG